ncbi:MAG: hypothetical protein IJ794_18310 [Lachnospiraceae bacterium]|nr:hypothetical protein [Lachnospiraceae bacterium]
MKKRLDYVTNSSSSSYVLALCSEAPGEEGETFFLSKALADCKITSLYDIISEFSVHIREQLSRMVYRTGMTEELREKYYQYRLLEAFSNVWWECMREYGKYVEADDLFDAMREELYRGGGLVPLICGKGQIEDEYLLYFETYELAEIMEYLEVQEKRFETVTGWLENVTGCRWVVTYGWEDGEPPKEQVMGSKVVSDSMLDEE